jgi:hypothetical protein
MFGYQMTIITAGSALNGLPSTGGIEKNTRRSRGTQTQAPQSALENRMDEEDV